MERQGFFCETVMKSRKCEIVLVARFGHFVHCFFQPAEQLETMKCPMPATAQKQSHAYRYRRSRPEDNGARSKISRVISLAPSVTESVFAVGAGDRLVGDTTYCNYPEEAKAIQKVGDTLNPNMETIVALKPDIVFVSGASQLETFTNTLDRNGIAVYVMNPTRLDEVFNDLDQLGDLFGTADKTANLVANAFEDREERLSGIASEDA